MSTHTMLMGSTYTTTEAGLYASTLLGNALLELKKLSQKVSLLTLAAFIGFSLADLLLTRLLIEKSGGAIYEANPLANLILTNLGWAGLTFFKFGMVCFVSLIVIYVAYYRPVMSRRLLKFACLITAGVVGYSLCLVGWFV